MKSKEKRGAQEQSEDSAGGGLRTVILALVALCTVGAVALSSGTAVGDAEPTKARIDEWEKEVMEGAATVGCSEREEAEYKRLSQQMSELLSVWQERARVDPGEALRMLKRVEFLLQCQKGEASEEGMLPALRSDLRAQVGGHLRAHHARLRRAQENEDTPRVLKELRALRRVLVDHRGPLTDSLRRLERRLSSGS